MRYKLRFYTAEDVLLGFDYNLELSVVIKNLLNPKYVEFLEKIGFRSGNRIFKPYTFSRLFPEKYQINSSGIEIKKGYVDIVISSIDENFWFSFLQGLLKQKKIHLSNNDFYLESIAIKKFRRKTRMILKTLSPFIVKGSYNNHDFSGIENELKQNLLNKVFVFKNKQFTEKDFNLKLFENTLRKTAVLINNTLNTAWHGLLMIEGNEDILETAYDAGLGLKNALGFGCVEDINLKEEKVVYRLKISV